MTFKERIPFFFSSEKWDYLTLILEWQFSRLKTTRHCCWGRRPQVWSLVRELRTHMLYSVAKRLKQKQKQAHSWFSLSNLYIRHCLQGTIIGDSANCWFCVSHLFFFFSIFSLCICTASLNPMCIRFGFVFIYPALDSPYFLQLSNQIFLIFFWNVSTISLYSLARI